jgi:hypothetical protein
MTRRHLTPSMKVEIALGKDILVEDSLAIVNTKLYQLTDNVID